MFQQVVPRANRLFSAVVGNPPTHPKRISFKMVRIYSSPWILRPLSIVIKGCLSAGKSVTKNQFYLQVHSALNQGSVLNPGTTVFFNLNIRFTDLKLSSNT